LFLTIFGSKNVQNAIGSMVAVLVIDRQNTGAKE
jgi:hypothetical protein